MEREGESLAPLGTPRSEASWPNPSGASRVEVVATSLVRPIREYELLVDSKVVGELEWIGGWHPELHLEAGAHSGYVTLRRLRPFVLTGRTEGPAPGAARILHVGSAGQGLIEIDGVQFARRTGVTGRKVVRDHDGRVVLTSSGTSGRGVLLYERGTSLLDVKWLLELTLVEAFCTIYPVRHMLRSMLTAWVRPPKMGAPLALLPAVSSLRLVAPSPHPHGLTLGNPRLESVRAGVRP